MEQNRLIACMDSTHKVVRSLRPDKVKKKIFTSAYLYTILVKDRNVQRGIPVAFMICNSVIMYGSKRHGFTPPS